MTARVTVISGPPRSGKTQRLLARYRGLLADRGPPAAALWLSPTWRAAAQLRWRLLGGMSEGCFGPGVMTFEKFADAVLEVAPVAIRPINRFMKRQLVRQLIEGQSAQGRLIHFRPIARTAGLVDLLCEFISELKRLEIWPEHFRRACHARGLSDKDVELAEIYDAYQQTLREHQLYDAEGRFWSARTLLQKGQRRPFDHLRLVVADGFSDFTRTQHEIIEILAGRVDELLISLPLESEPRRTDLFSKPLATLSELRRRHRQLAHQELSRPEQTGWPAMAHVEKTLFTSPRSAGPAEETAGVEILAAAREPGEIELIGSRIKRLLCEEKVPPGDIAVVFRRAQDAGSLLAEVFGNLGIPVALELGQALDHSPALAALVALLRLDAEDWPFAGLLAVLGGNYFQPDWPECQQGKAAAAVRQTIRRLQIPRGRDRLLGELPTVEGSLLRRLAAALDELPEKATLAEWGSAWRRLAEQTGLLRTIEQDLPGGPQTGLPDRTAWARLMDVLAAGDTLAAWLRQRPPELDRGEALAALLDILGSERVGPSGDESGRVRVLSAASVRTLGVPYLFLAGLSEKAFPPPQREDRLYSEAECQRLIEEGLPLVARGERNRDEMLLFYETLSRATRRLYLSYPALDQSAQPLMPSPYLKEVEQACGGRIARTESTDLSPVPVGDEPLSAAEFRLKALAMAVEGDEALLAGLLRQEPTPGLAENVLAGLQLIHMRQDRQRFSPAEGMLPGDAAGRRLCDRFDLQRTFGVTELEQYAGCPFRFFAEQVLKLEPVEDLALAVDYMQRGRLAHHVLAAFHQKVNRSLGRPASPLELDAAEYDRLMSRTLDELCGGRFDNPLAAAMREIDRRLLDQWIANYAEQHQRYDALWQECDAPLVPELFEVSFGHAGGGQRRPSTEEPLEFVTESETIRLSGRIDRIDTGEVAGTTVLNVLDYKTGGSARFGAEDIAAGTALQLPLYALAAAELLLGDRNAVPWQAGYWYLRENGFRPKQALKMYRRAAGGVEPEAEWEEIRAKITETVAALVGGIRRGQFPVCSRDEKCTGYCPYHTICRVNQVRSLEKTWQPTGGI